MQPARKQRNQNKINLLVDLVIFITFLVVMAPRSAGIAVHEWLSIAFGAAIIAHLLLNWQWLAGVTKRLLGQVQGLTRATYVLNMLLFIDMTIALFSGLMISEQALPRLGLQTTRGGIWRAVHGASANSVLFLVGLHLALNWQWFASAARRYVIAPLSPRRAADLSHEPQPTLPEA